METADKANRGVTKGVKCDFQKYANFFLFLLRHA